MALTLTAPPITNRATRFLRLLVRPKTAAHAVRLTCQGLLRKDHYWPTARAFSSAAEHPHCDTLDDAAGVSSWHPISGHRMAHHRRRFIRRRPCPVSEGVRHANVDL